MKMKVVLWLIVVNLLNLICDVSDEFKRERNNAKYTSPQNQNDVFSFFNIMIHNKIINELDKYQYLSISL